MTPHRQSAAERLEQRKNRRRQEILDAAAELFSRQGYDATTADAIAAAVHLTKSALYTYVGSKEEIAVRLLASVIEQLLREADAIGARGGDPALRLHRLIARHISVLGHHPASSLLFWHSEHIVSAEVYPDLYRLRDRYERVVRDWIAEGIQCGDFGVSDPKVAGFMVLGSMNWVIRWFSPQGQQTIEALGEEFARMLVGGLRCPEQPENRGRADVGGQ